MAKLRHFAGLGIALCTSASAAAGAEAQKSAGNAPPAKDRVVCFAEPVTGSHLKSVCMTEEEREQRRKADQEAMQGLKRPGATNNPKERM